ncbi:MULTISPECIES: hypothetical protein [unclassified Brevibacterium]|uniref:hypothetical protein n=1 Tax=Micrococcales TaxID=85006 RepID=UPI0010822F6C|nr:hypothetical protein [Brevibacterium sp. S111]TGD10626.1 hypothetical protein EB836_10525 [Brevibacterium sp. S111]
MDVATTRDEEVARTLASRAFSRHMAFDAIGSVDAEAMDLIRQAVLRAWEQAGSPPGALRRAAVLSAELPRLIAENQAPADLETEGISRERETVVAEQASALLAVLAAEIDPAPAHDSPPPR